MIGKKKREPELGWAGLGWQVALLGSVRSILLLVNSYAINIIARLPENARGKL